MLSRFDVIALTARKRRNSSTSRYDSICLSNAASSDSWISLRKSMKRFCVAGVPSVLVT
jgi:hypothetical protein